MRVSLPNRDNGTNGACLFTCAVAVGVTVLYCWIFVEAFVWVRAMLPDAAGTESLLAGSGITGRVIFDFVALGLLWHYLTPRKLYRYLRREIQALRDRGPLGKSGVRLQPWWL